MPLKDRYLLGSSLIQWLRDDIGLFNHATDTQSLALSVPDSDGVAIVPALTGLGAPHWAPDATGVICGLKRSTTKAHIARAALEAIALQTNDIIQTLCHDWSKRVLNYHAS